MAARKETTPVPTVAVATPSGTLDSPVKQIQIEGLVSVTAAPWSCVLKFSSGCEGETGLQLLASVGES